jgi:hypothetical protein
MGPDSSPRVELGLRKPNLFLLEGRFDRWIFLIGSTRQLVLLRWQFAYSWASCPGCVFKRNPTKVLGPLQLKPEMVDSKMTLLLISIAHYSNICSNWACRLERQFGNVDFKLAF